MKSDHKTIQQCSIIDYLEILYKLSTFLLFQVVFNLAMDFYVSLFPAVASLLAGLRVAGSLSSIRCQLCELVTDSSTGSVLLLGTATCNIN